MSFGKMVELLQRKDNGKIILVNSGSFYIARGRDAVLLHNILNLKVNCMEADVNVNSFCSFLAKKYVGFWQRFIRGGIFPLFIVFLYLKMLLLNYQQMLLR